jgi:hypothetical protein
MEAPEPPDWKMFEGQAAILRANLEEPDREASEDPTTPFGPLAGLGLGDPATIRQVLRKIGVDRLVITPDGDGWRFAGPADFTRLVHGRVKAGPPKPPTLGDAPAQPGRPSISLC